MVSNQESTEQGHKDFYISYAEQDQRWAEWIAMQLETAGYTLFIQAWDVRPGANFVEEMNTAARCTDRTLLVLSSTYLTADTTLAEWATAFRRDSKGKDGRILPVRIQQCEVEGFLGSIVYIDLVDLDEPQARTQLLAGVPRERAKPLNVPFPDSSTPSKGSATQRESPIFPGSLPPIWNVPYPRNTLFIGREELLTQLATTIQTSQPTTLSQPQAISGLGGIGKTQIALEYAYRFRHRYHAVLWAQADTPENLSSSYLSLALLLNLPQQHEQEAARVITAIKTWLQTQANWLLILDNADDLLLARDFLPPSMSGHILITTRAHTTGRFAHRLEINVLPPEHARLFLLRRAALLAPYASIELASQEDRDLARTLCEELGELPLALDQAGAYIEETGCGLANYLRLFQQHRADLLAERRGLLVDDHPLPVATTWSLSFQNVEAKIPAAADLLRLCAFLAPDAIPETIITEGASHLGPHLASVGADAYLLNQAIDALHAYSLLSRETSSAGSLLSVHRLVQAVLKDQMDEPNHQIWAERTVQAIYAALPPVDHQNWSHWERLLSHALAAYELCVRYHLQDLHTSHLLQQTGWYLIQRGRYREAEPLLTSALSILEQEHPTHHLHLSSVSSTLALLYSRQGKYAEAEPLYTRALAIFEQELGALHPSTATSLNNLAALYQSQGKYAEAEPLYARALAIREQVLGALHPSTATSLNNLAHLYQSQSKYAQAEPLYARALAIVEQELGAQHPDTATSLNNLAHLYESQGNYAQAEPLYARALAIAEQVLGALHPDTAQSLNNLAALYSRQGKYAEAEPLFVRALAIREQVLGAQHPDTASSLNNLAYLYQSQGKYAEAEPLFVRALAIREQVLGAQHPDTASSLNNLAYLYQSQGKYAEAEPLFVRALAIREQVLGVQHPDTASSLNNLAYLYQSQGKYAEAEPLYARALAIVEQVLGAQHPDTAQSLNNLAYLYQSQGKYAQAEPLYARALAIVEQVLGAQHPDTAQSLNNLAALYSRQGKYAQAEPLYARALAIVEQVLGAQHPDTATSLNNLAALYQSQGKYAQAEPLYARALAIAEQVLGALHPDTAQSLNNLAALYSRQGNYKDAEGLFQRAFAIREQALGASHPDTASSLWWLAILSEQQYRFEEAKPLYEHAISIFERTLGLEHPTTKSILQQYAALLETMKQDTPSDS